MKRKEKIAKELYKSMDKALLYVSVMILMIFIGIIWIGGMFVVGFFLKHLNIFAVLFILSYAMILYSYITHHLWSFFTKTKEEK